MGRRQRELLPWEATVKCASCGAEPGQRCHTINGRYPADHRWASPQPTAPHKVRYEQWWADFSFAAGL